MANFRITFRSEIYINADNIDDARREWEQTCLWSDDARKKSAEFIEIVSVENETEDKDVTDEF
jgi:hypothetical protein